MIDVDKYVPFLVKNKLTQEQFLLMYLIHFRKYDLIKLYKSRFTNEDDTMISENQTNDLIERKFIIVKGENADEVVLTEKFTRIFGNTPNLDLPILGEYRKAADEFWIKYPAFVPIQGRNIPLTLMDKNEFRKLYLVAINFDLAEHKKVIKDLEYAIKHELIFGKIDMFVKSEQWCRIREVRDGVTDVQAYLSANQHDF